MSDEIVDNLKKPSAWMRVLFMAGFVVALYVTGVVLLVIMLAQIIFSLLTGGDNQNLRRMGAGLSSYVSEILAYLTYNSELRPFPFSNFPQQPGAESAPEPAPAPEPDPEPRPKPQAYAEPESKPASPSTELAVSAEIVSETESARHSAVEPAPASETESKPRAVKKKPAATKKTTTTKKSTTARKPATRKPRTNTRAAKTEGDGDS